ncbi:MAG: hypothetical protein IJ776_04160 [Paludibacteraceae bacterium]|nr:hypothetical protein [Paludibacteraceae bacterium]
MKKCLYILLLTLLPLCSFADVRLTLKSGHTLTGTVVFRNEEVIVVKSAEGQRFQYPMSEVADIAEVDEQAIKNEDTKPVTAAKKVGVSLHLSGGPAFIPHDAAGGAFDAMVFVGACNLLDKHIFIGGGVGYESFFMFPVGEHNFSTASFIPVQVRFSAPLMPTRHAPALGCSLGYGFSPKGIGKSGICASLDAGWRWQINEKMAMFAGITAAFQQGKTSVDETIDDKTYTSDAVRNFCKLGLKLAVQF